MLTIVDGSKVVFEKRPSGTRQLLLLRQAPQRSVRDPGEPAKPQPSHPLGPGQPLAGLPGTHLYGFHGQAPTAGSALPPRTASITTWGWSSWTCTVVGAGDASAAREALSLRGLPTGVGDQPVEDRLGP